MSAGKQFTQEELQRLVNNPDAVRFMATASGTMEEMRARARKLYLPPSTLVEQLEAEHMKAEGDLRRVLAYAALEVENLTKRTLRRPLSELRQEPWKGGGPDRKILLWWKTEHDPEWVCLFGRKDPLCKGGFLDSNGAPLHVSMKFTHFSELPRDDADADS